MAICGSSRFALALGCCPQPQTTQSISTWPVKTDRAPLFVTPRRLREERCCIRRRRYEAGEPDPPRRRSPKRRAGEAQLALSARHAPRARTACWNPHARSPLEPAYTTLINGNRKHDAPRAVRWLAGWDRGRGAQAKRSGETRRSLRDVISRPRCAMGGGVMTARTGRCACTRQESRRGWSATASRRRDWPRSRTPACVRRARRRGSS